MNFSQVKNSGLAPSNHSPFFSREGKSNFFRKREPSGSFFSSNDVLPKLTMGRSDASKPPSILTKCSGCEEEKKLQEKQEGSGPSTAPSTVENSLTSSKGSGSPLPLNTRMQMEKSIGADFSGVRLHTDSTAVQMNKDLHAQAFTHGNDIYFNSGKYDVNSKGGQSLLAHELTHVVQQGALPITPVHSSAVSPSIENADVNRSAMPCVQRMGDLSKVPADLPCPVANTSPGSSGTSVIFGAGNSILTAAEKSKLSAVAAAWHTGGEAGILRIDGFASTEGSDVVNWRLSCSRALAVATELEVPSDGSPGVSNTNIELFAQGETSEFSTSLAPNRRAVITTTGGAPAPGPACGLAVTGPDEVDHYCAAYVPSDALACGVFPAPNIPLTVTGASAGTTPFWTIIRGGSRASIVGPSAGTSINIKGEAPSNSQGDVTVQVTDGNCTVTHRITVREPTSMPAATVSSSGPSFVQVLATYTVLDQFGNPMQANICWDETVTTCANSHPGGAHARGDVGTNANGQVTDRLNASVATGTLPASLCAKLNQTITVGGCGPLAQNVILFQASGASLNQNSSCTSGDPCP